jgi:hypothetical protein
MMFNKKKLLKTFYAIDLLLHGMLGLVSHFGAIFYILKRLTKISEKKFVEECVFS